MSHIRQMSPKPLRLKAISTHYTTWRISKGGQLLHLKMIRSINVSIFCRNTTSQSFYSSRI